MTPPVPWGIGSPEFRQRPNWSQLRGGSGGTAAALVASMLAELDSPPVMLPVPQRTDLAMRRIGERQAAPHTRVLLHAMAVLGLLVFMGWSMF